MNGALTLGAALLLGLAASGHCLVMCGGISAALGIATANNANGHPQARLLVGYQLGRIASYTLAGLLLGGIFAALIGLLDTDNLRRVLRVLAAMAMLLGALVAFGRVREFGSGIGRQLWLRIAPLGRRLLPVTTFPRSFAFGMVWGFMPCGFVYTVLLIATVQLDAARSALTMTMFGLGTLPAMFVAAFGARRFAGFSIRPAARRFAGAALLLSAALTLISPWLPESAWLHAWLPFVCTTR
ncbi:MAG: sulfite exporter TauE/SafE family protein [Burkholderiales bacterium]|nr:sulfite exporter TauE/SafE family protein [Burkholderiales bacterium]